MNKDANNSYESDYINKCGGFYEIVEKDKAGNYTQYVIYFAPQKEAQVSINITGKVIGTNYSSTTLPFNITEIEDEAFTGITGVTSVAGLASKNGNQSYPYYGNINIYNSSREKIKTIYINSTSDHNKYEKKKETDEDGVEYEIEVLKEEGFEQEIYNVIKEQGNYIIEYVNVFGKTYTIFVNNYTSDKHKLTTATFALQTDYAGQDYLTFSGLNSRIDDRTYWYVTEVKITYYSNAEIIYTAGPPENGQTELNRPNGENEVWRDSVELDRLNLKKGIQYLVTLTDVGGNKYHIPISTSENYYNYRLFKPDNIYSRDNVVYTANQIQLSYNTDFYEDDIIVYVNGEVQSLEGDEYKQFYTYSNTGSYCLVTLLPDVMTTTSKADYYGSLRRFEVKLKLKDGEDYSQTYDIYIDTRATDFTIENTNKVDKIEFIKSTFKNDKDEDGLYQDYNIMDLRNSIYYEKLISETINISWTRLTNDYFTYNYELFEFISADEYVELLKNSTDTFYTIAPKESNTGKYVLKVTIEGKDGTWIATRVYGIFMSTTITGLYEVKDGDGYIYDYASITNLGEIKETYKGNETAMAIGLGFVDSQGNADTVAMHKVFNSFGLKTAIPMYIANTELTLHSNQDNGVSSKAYEPTASGYAKISVHRIYRSNYQTFAVIMQV
ncbi:MAG: hypothetical protein IJ371_06730, partial [Clostridia bacterium]|nr:hypothetical protein [Clostridia bacterium]